MPRGGKRPNAGRKRVTPELPEANKAIATIALASPPQSGKFGWKGEIETWRELLGSTDGRLQFDVLKYLTDKRDGKAVQNLNHIHDKPIEMNVSLSMAELIREVRQRKQDYERSRK